MKSILLVFACLTTFYSQGQGDALASAVYSFNKAPVTENKMGEGRKIMNGSTLDLANLEVHTTTLVAGKTNHPPVAHYNKEELVIVKDGSLQININGETKVLGPGGLALIVAGDIQSFTNATDQPATYYVLGYQPKAPLNIERGKQGGGSFMVDWKDLEVRQTDKGESRPIFNRPSTAFPHFDVHATALNPGISSHAAHTHRAEEIILMIKGSGEMQLGDSMHKARAGDVILANANIPHAFTNTGNEQCGYFAIQWHHD